MRSELPVASNDVSQQWRFTGLLIIANAHLLIAECRLKRYTVAAFWLVKTPELDHAGQKTQLSLQAMI
jgi:hypothetical protein